MTKIKAVFEVSGGITGPLMSCLEVTASVSSKINNASIGQNLVELRVKIFT